MTIFAARFATLRVDGDEDQHFDVRCGAGWPRSTDNLATHITLAGPDAGGAIFARKPIDFDYFGMSRYLAIFVVR